MTNTCPKVVAIGGGTGLSTMLRGVKKHTSDITAVVTVSDNGGNSGVLREEMNIIPPGDVRNCLVALANTEPIMKELLQYRFEEGALSGQNLGNLFLAALTDISGNFEKAVQVTSKVLAITGKVLPVTLQDIQLVGTFEGGKEIEGETQIVAYSKATQKQLTNIRLEPQTIHTTPDVLQAIKEADIITLGPGSLYTSIIPNLLVEDVTAAIRASKAKKIYIANIMSQPGETTGYTIEDHIKVLERYAGGPIVDCVIVNDQAIRQEYLERYAEDGAYALVRNPNDAVWQTIQCIEAPLVRINHEKAYIRHDSNVLATYILDKA